jgi:hypothetical protein
MFYSGGAPKKRAVLRILHHTKKEDKSTNEVADDTKKEDEEEDTRDSRSMSRSRSMSNKRRDSKSSDKTESDDDTESGDESDSSQPPEVNDYVTTVSSDLQVISRYHYYFVDNELDYSIEHIEDGYHKESPVDIFNEKEIRDFSLVIYRINTRQDIPFLEFLFYHDKSAGTCGLPYYHHKKHYSTGKKHIKTGLDDIVGQLFSTKTRYKGYIYDAQTHRCFVFYEKYFDANSRPLLISLQKPFNWVWVCSTEIINERMYLNIPIDDTAIDFFTAYPMVGLLQTSASSSSRACNIEAPNILYTGANYCYTANTALYGLKREPITSRYGPFYYFTTFDSSFRWACYNYKNIVSFGPTFENVKIVSKEGDRYTSGGGGGISRYAVFTKRMKTVFLDDEYDPEIVKKYKLKKSLFEGGVGSNSNHKNAASGNTAGYSEYLDKTSSLHSYDYSWTSHYDTIYNGFYEFKEKHHQTHTNKTILPVWCIYNHRNFEPLSYYQVDTKDIPVTYDYKFNDYRIL